MAENERQQRLIERIQEDERLRGDLPDHAATALVAWASAQASAAAADPARPDQDVEAAVLAIRAAARNAARSGLTASHEIIAFAEAAIAPQPPPLPAPPVRRRWLSRTRGRIGEAIRRWLLRKEA